MLSTHVTLKKSKLIFSFQKLRLNYFVTHENFILMAKMRLDLTTADRYWLTVRADCKMVLYQLKTHYFCLTLCASSTLTCKCASQDRIIPCISCPHGAKDWSGFCSHFVHFGRTDFSLCNISSKEHTKYITKQESLPEKFILLWFFMYKTVRQSSSDSTGIAPGPGKASRV